jgi:hypothetical protein
VSLCQLRLHAETIADVEFSRHRYRRGGIAGKRCARLDELVAARAPIQRHGHAAWCALA